MDPFDALNLIYKPLCDKAADIHQALRDAGFQAKTQFHNNHSVKRGGAFVTEHFPIPVVFVEGVGSIGADLDAVWFELELTKQQALALDYAALTGRYAIEIYGSEKYLDDLVDRHTPVSEIAGRLADCPEQRLCVLFSLPADVPCDTLVDIARLV